MHQIPGVGFLKQPGSANRVPAGMPWALDNGCFAGAFDDRRFMALVSPEAIFCALPDVIADWTATLDRSHAWIAPMRERGGRPAIVLQDGATTSTVPWDQIDAVFIGGSTTWKLGETVPGLVAEARRRGKHVHMGRVNSMVRIRLARQLGCHSVDGTHIKFRPERRSSEIATWIVRLTQQPDLGLWRFLGDKP